jgi:recombination protein RecA
MSKKKISSSKFNDDVVSSSIVSKYGDVVRSGKEVLDSINNLEVIGVSPAVDIALGGGLREGSVVVMTGDPKSGKIYIDTEGRMNEQNFTGIKGLDPDKIIVIQSTDDRILSAEDFLNIVEYYINNDPGCLIITDSLSNMVPACELEGEVRTGVRNALPRLLSMFFKRISGTHNIANTGGSPYAPSKMADCGNMLQYQAGTNMIITHRGKWQVPKDSGPHVGQIANWVVKTSNAGGRPNSTAESWIRYGVGIDEVQEVVQIACEFRLIKTAGAWYTIACAVDEPQHPVIAKILADNNVGDKQEDIERFFKFQGSNNVLEFLNNHYEIAQFIYEKIKELY